MNQYLWSAALRFARLLPTDEAEAVCGDLLESHASGRHAIQSILGLVLRRQLACWQSWQPWAAFAGIAVVSAIASSRFLFLFAAGVDQQLRTYLKYGVHYETGLTPGQDLLYFTTVGVLLLIWSWSSAYLLTRLSGQAIWLLAPVFWMVVQNAFFLQSLRNGSLITDPHMPVWLLCIEHVLPVHPAQTCFLLLAIAGFLRGSSTTPISPHMARVVASAATLLCLLMFLGETWYEAARLRWSEGLWKETPAIVRLLPILLAAWPSLLMPWLNRLNGVNQRNLKAHA